MHSAAFRRLQGKTQLFPGIESDFFRNRLTHSLAVAEIGEQIAHRLNHSSEYLSSGKWQIHPQVVNVAGLAHDLGHPPFGHNGEHALDDCMKECGGFEGNAQTLRILTTLEKKELLDSGRSGEPLQFDHTGEFVGIDPGGRDLRLGLNLTYRVLASILNYDRKIESYRQDKSPVKGYFETDADFVRTIKEKVAGDPTLMGFKTVECQIMDLADDIAYSTNDLEDTFKAGFLSPLDVLASSPQLLERVAGRVSERLSADGEAVTVDEVEVLDRLEQVFAHFIMQQKPASLYEATLISKNSKNYCDNGYFRTEMTATLIAWFIKHVKISRNETHPTHPQLARVSVEHDIKVLIEILKVYTYEATIMSARLRVTEARGYDIVRSIFDKLTGKKGRDLLPADFQTLYDRSQNDKTKRRIVCDFVAGMTDRYAVEFYSRLNGETHQSIFKPL
jgi:dGTPase